MILHDNADSHATNATQQTMVALVFSQSPNPMLLIWLASPTGIVLLQWNTHGGER